MAKWKKKKQKENIVNAIKVVNIEKPKIITEGTGEFNNSLVALMDKYSAYSSTGNIVSKMNTGCLKIRLKKEEIIYYNPF